LWWKLNNRALATEVSRAARTTVKRMKGDYWFDVRLGLSDAAGFCKHWPYELGDLPLDRGDIRAMTKCKRLGVARALREGTFPAPHENGWWASDVIAWIGMRQAIKSQRRTRP
jgi:hypothetical protein